MMDETHSNKDHTYICFLTLLAISASVIVASVGTQSYLTLQKTNELSERIDILVPLLQPDDGDSVAAVYRHVHRLATALNLRITLLDSNGTVLIDSDVPLESLASLENHFHRPEIEQALVTPVGSSTRMSATVNEEFLYVARTVHFPETDGMLHRVKFFRLSAHLGDILTVARELRKSIFLAGIIVLALVIGVSLLISRRIATPMMDIATAVDRIRAGNLDTQIHVRGSDEVAQVGQAVNEMVIKLKEDITQLKKLERVRSEFLGNVSHELRTPLFSLQGFLETLLNGAVDDPAVNRDFLQKAFNHSVRLNTLLGDLITISHIESGEMKMSFRYFNLKEFLTTVVEESAVIAERNNVQLRLAETLSAGVEVVGDKERLYVVMENLLENAIKYNKPGGEVVVSFNKEGDGVRINVADTGVGVAQEHHSRIFERFYRADKNRSHEVGGTGLGLAIVKHIIEAHGSKVRIESTPGKGSVFSFSLKR